MAHIYQTTRGHGVDYRDGYGVRHRIHVGSEPAARTLAASLEAEAHSTRSAIRRFSHTTDCTLSEGIVAYFNARAASKATRDTERLRLTRISKALGQVQLSLVSPKLLTDYLEVRRQELSPGTLYAEARLIHRLFAWLCERWFLPLNPAPAIQVPPPRVSCARALTADELQAIQNAASSYSWLKILLALDAGLRYSEVVALRLQHLDVANRELLVFSRKTRTQRNVPMTNRLFLAVMERAQQLEDPDAHLLQWGAKPGYPKSAFMRHLREKVGFHFRFHDLRHTFATRLAGVAQRPRILQTLLGHRPLTVTDLYDHPNREELRAAIDAMEQTDRDRAPGGTKP
jgi:integrase